MTRSPPKLFVYVKALHAAEVCELVARSIVRTRPDLADQLRRASSSVPLNIAEGAGEFRPKEKARFYRIARRSAFESEAALDVVDRVVEHPPDTTKARTALNETLALLARTIQSLEAPISLTRG